MPRKSNFLEDPPLREPISRKVSIVTPDSIEEMVLKLFAKYDKDRNGYLDKNEVLKLLDEILMNQGRPKTTAQ